jgi:hypothetical protein
LDRRVTINLGTDAIDALYVGTDAVSKVYLGADEVWPSAPDPFAPEDIVGCVACWHADDLALADGATVLSWTDRKNGLVLAKYAAQNAPTLDLDGLGGQPAVNSAGQFLELVGANPVSTALSGHVFAVVQFQLLPSGARSIWASTNLSGTNDTTYLKGVVQSTGGIGVQQNAAGVGTDHVRSTTPPSLTTPYLVELASNGSAYELRQNNTVQTNSVVTGADTGDWFGDSAGRGNFSVFGSRTTGAVSSLSSHRLAMLLVVDGAISGGDRAGLNAYVATKYGITLAP